MDGGDCITCHINAVGNYYTYLLHLCVCSGASGETAAGSAAEATPASPKDLQEEEWKTELARVRYAL